MNEREEENIKWKVQEEECVWQSKLKSLRWEASSLLIKGNETKLKEIIQTKLLKLFFQNKE